MQINEPSEREKVLAMQERRDRKIKPRKPDDDMLLLNFGTEREGFTPNQIVQAAIADMKRRERNEVRRADRRDRKAKKLPTKDISPVEKTAFVGRHVRAAKSPAHLIELALSDRSRGEKATEANTVRLYRSVEAMRQAALIAKAAIVPTDAPTQEVGLPI